VVVVLLLPTLCGGLAKSMVEQSFASMFRGTLAVKEISLAWNGPQKVTEAVLYDPEKHEVARVTMELPSLLAVMRWKGPWKLRVDADADLVADDQGVVNLQRALAPREPEKTTKHTKHEDATSDPLGMISTLDAEVVIASRHLSWSDADTRRAGKPFEIRDFTATLRAKPGQPLTIHAQGQVASQTPGALEIDATLHGPLESGKAWPFGDVDANVRIEGFSTPMIDGIAGLGGKLTEVLGPQFDLKVRAAGVTPQKGDVELAFSSPRSSLDFAGKFEGGLLRARDGQPVKLSVGVPRGFVTDWVATKLPAGVRVTWEETAKPWTVSITDLELPIPDASALDMKGLAKSFEHLRCGIDVDLPARILLESASPSGASVKTGIESPTAHVAISPGTPAVLAFRTKLVGWAESGIALDAQVADPWRALGEGKIPVVQATASAKVPTAAIDAVLGPSGPGLSRLGQRLELDLVAKDASPDSGGFDLAVKLEGDKAKAIDVRAKGTFESGRIVCAGPEGVAIDVDPAALAPFLPPTVRMSPSGAPIRIRVADLVAPLADPLGKDLAFGFTCTTGSTGITVGSLTLIGLDVAAKLAAADLDVRLDAAADPSGESKIHLTAKLHEPLRLLEFPAKGVNAVNAELAIQKLPPTALDMLAAALPPGAKVSIGGAIQVSVHDFMCAPLPGAKPDAKAMLAAVVGKVTTRLDSVGYADEHTRAAKVDVLLREIKCTAQLEAGKPLSTTMEAVIDAGPGGHAGLLRVGSTIADPSAYLGDGKAPFPRVTANIIDLEFSTALLDALSGRPGVVSGLVGATAHLDVHCEVASADSGTFTATLKSPLTSVGVAAKLDQGMITSIDQPTVDVSSTLSQAWLDQQIGALLPAGAKLSIAEGSGPIRLTVKDVRVPLPQGPITADAFAAISAHVSASAPDLAYSDAKTAAAGGPAVLRGIALDADVAPGKPPALKLAAKIESTPPGEISATVRALDPMANLAAEKGLEHFHIAADVTAKSVPTGLLDALAAQGGMLVEMLGPRLDAAVHSDSISKSDGSFTASLDSEKASVHCDHGSMKDGVLQLEKSKGKTEALLAHAPLTPLFSERVVGKLVPAMVHLEKPEGADAVMLAVEDLKMPLDADLSKLDALVRLNLGEVSYRLLPGLATVLGKSDATTVKLPELRIPIEKGVARYDSLPIRIGGKDCIFKGTFSLVDQTFKLDTQLPLSVLGKGVNGKLDGLRGVLDPNTMVPIEVRGTWKSPKIGIGDEFLKKVAEDALKKEGGNLLDGLLKKKKKD
jgi:hypothetical protein